jgi:hypothetical protein
MRLRADRGGERRCAAEFCKDPSIVHGGHLHNDYCFAEDGDADTFMRRFGGETFDPEQRGKGR